MNSVQNGESFLFIVVRCGSRLVPSLHPIRRSEATSNLSLALREEPAQGNYSSDRGNGYTRSRPARPSPSGRGRRVQHFSITAVPEIAQRPSAKHQSDACCSLSLRERVRVALPLN